MLLDNYKLEIMMISLTFVVEDTGGGGQPQGRPVGKGKGVGSRGLLLCLQL